MRHLYINQARKRLSTGSGEMHLLNYQADLNIYTLVVCVGKGCRDSSEKGKRGEAMTTEWWQLELSQKHVPSHERWKEPDIRGNHRRVGGTEVRT